MDKIVKRFLRVHFFELGAICKIKKMAPKMKKMAPNTPSDLPVPFSQVDALKKMAPCFCGFNWENDSRSHFFDQKRVKPAVILHLQNSVYFFSLFLKKMAPKERIAGQVPFFEAIFFKRFTCENGTPSSDGVFLSFRSHFFHFRSHFFCFRSHFFISQMASGFCIFLYDLIHIKLIQK